MEGAGGSDASAQTPAARPVPEAKVAGPGSNSTDHTSGRLGPTSPAGSTSPTNPAGPTSPANPGPDSEDATLDPVPLQDHCPDRDLPPLESFTE